MSYPLTIVGVASVTVASEVNGSVLLLELFLTFALLDDLAHVLYVSVIPLFGLSRALAAIFVSLG